MAPPDGAAADPERMDAVLHTAAAWALHWIATPYPTSMQLLALEPADVAPATVRTPAFSGCYDWHSAVHAHWALARLVRCGHAGAPWEQVEATFERTLTPANIAAELRHLRAPGREGFERPYGLAWLLLLHAELVAWAEADGPAAARRWAGELAPLVGLAGARIVSWAQGLPAAVRSGEHACSPFAMELAIHAAAATGEHEAHARLSARARALHELDEDLPLHLEPGGQDFVSPSLAAASLMSVVLPRAEFRRWFAVACPPARLEDARARDGAPRYVPVVELDRRDGKLAHLDGLAWSRAWMLAAIARALGEDHPRTAALTALARLHRLAGAAAVLSATHASTTHWLGTFAVRTLLGALTPPRRQSP